MLAIADDCADKWVPPPIGIVMLPAADVALFGFELLVDIEVSTDLDPGIDEFIGSDESIGVDEPIDIGIMDIDFMSLPGSATPGSVRDCVTYYILKTNAYPCHPYYSYRRTQRNSSLVLKGGIERFPCR